MNKKFVIFVFISLVVLTLLTPFWVFKDLLFPFVTSKAFYLRIVVELTLPFYLFLLFSTPSYRPSFKNPLTIAVVAFFLFNLVSAFFGVNPLRSIWGNFERMGGVFYLGHLILLYFYVLMIGQINVRYFRLFLQILLGVGTALCLDGVMVRLTQNHFLLNDPSYPRVSGTFGNPIFIASFLVIPMFIAVFFAVSEEAVWKKISYWALVILQAWVIFLSGTRGAIVGLGIGIFTAATIYVLFSSAKKVRIWGGSAVLAFGLAVVLLFAFHSRLPQGTMLHRVFNLRDSNTEARLIQWGVALKGYKDYPILGVGPENYSVIANKNYNPAIYKYDPSWFDKPHNYLIEVLVTSGILGFGAYAAILVFCLWALWKALKKGIIILSEFCILVCAIIVYEVQNLFVFDTIAASMAFFIFIGFMAYLWHESNKPETGEKKIKSKPDPAFLYTVFGLSSVFSLYLVYACNVTGLQVAKAVNYGYAYSNTDPKAAQNYFETGRNSPFNFDPVQFASKYGEFAINLSSSADSKNAELAKKVLQDALAQSQEAVARVPSEPTAWMQLANLYLTQAMVNKTALDPKATEAAQKAMDLAPKRPEPEQTMARIRLAQNNIPEAQKLLEDIIKNIPEHKEAKLQLAISYVYSGQPDKALQLGEELLATGYIPAQAGQIDWMGQAYQNKNDYINAARIYEIAIRIDPGNLQDAWLLAQMDARIGKKDEAIKITQGLMPQVKPDEAAQMQKFIDSLK